VKTDQYRDGSEVFIVRGSSSTCLLSILSNIWISETLI